MKILSQKFDRKMLPRNRRIKFSMMINDASHYLFVIPENKNKKFKQK